MGRRNDVEALWLFLTQFLGHILCRKAFIAHTDSSSSLISRAFIDQTWLISFRYLLIIGRSEIYFQLEKLWIHNCRFVSKHESTILGVCGWKVISTLFGGEQLLTKEGRETHIFFRREECENTVFYLIFRSQTEWMNLAFLTCMYLITLKVDAFWGPRNTLHYCHCTPS